MDEWIDVDGWMGEWCGNVESTRVYSTYFFIIIINKEILLCYQNRVDNTNETFSEEWTMFSNHNVKFSPAFQVEKNLMECFASSILSNLHIYLHKFYEYTTIQLEL